MQNNSSHCVISCILVTSVSYHTGERSGITVATKRASYLAVKKHAVLITSLKSFLKTFLKKGFDLTSLKGLERGGNSYKNRQRNNSA